MLQETRRLHYVGSSLGLLFFAIALFTGRWLFVPLGMVCGYTPAWVAHFFVECNRYEGMYIVANYVLSAAPKVPFYAGLPPSNIQDGLGGRTSECTFCGLAASLTPTCERQASQLSNEATA